jgi:hypothetical protein
MTLSRSRLVDPALGVEHVAARLGDVEHRLAHGVVAAGALETLLGAVINARHAEGAQQVADRADDLLIGRAVGDPTVGLPERVVVVDERDQVAAELATVCGSTAK